jgi:hypothetical protein
MTAPTFAAVFGAAWDGLPPAMKLHYANRPFTHDRMTVEGTLDIRMGPLMRCLAPVFAAMGMLTPRDGTGIACTVRFLSEPETNAFVFERWFHFPDRKPFRFCSRLVPKHGDEVVEYMPCGIGWACRYGYEDGRVLLRHRGYVWRLFGADIPLPFASLVMGRGDAWEEATGERSFRMSMAMGGGLLGKLMAYGYTGQFTVTEAALDG